MIVSEFPSEQQIEPPRVERFNLVSPRPRTALSLSPVVAGTGTSITVQAFPSRWQSPSRGRASIIVFGTIAS